MKSIKSLVGIVAFPVLAVSAAGGCSADAPADPTDTTRANVTSAPSAKEAVSLKPADEAEVLLDAVDVTVKDDGAMNVHLQGTASAAKPVTFSFAIDTKAGTYKTRHVAREATEAAPEVGQRTEAVNDDKASAPARASVGTFGAVNPGTWVATVRMQTIDPCVKVLAQTRNQLAWTVDPNGAMRWSSYADECTGYTVVNPCLIIPITTHWYNSSCTVAGPYYSGANPVNDAAGAYYNWDFLNPSLATYANHSITITGQSDGTFTYSTSYSDSGEFYQGAIKLIFLN